MKKLMIFQLLASLIIGCSYPLEITNRPPTSSVMKPTKAVKIGILPSEDPLINAAIEEISLNSAVASAKKGYQIGSGVDVDYVSGLSQNMKFTASGQNFWITFPGFILFTHSWLGYKYYIDIDTQSKILDPSGKVLNEASIVTPYEIRYTSFARGSAAALVGWIVPGFGLFDIIPGAMFASDYDQRATPEFIEKVKPSYKAFVANKVLEQIAGVQGKASNKSIFKMAPVVIGDEGSNEAAISASERHFVVHMMKVEGERLIPIKDEVKELSKETYQLLDRITKKELKLNAGDLNNILASLGISGVPLPTDVGLISIYTMQDDKMVGLYNGSDFQVAHMRK